MWDEEGKGRTCSQLFSILASYRAFAQLSFYLLFPYFHFYFLSFNYYSLQAIIQKKVGKDHALGIFTLTTCPRQPQKTCGQGGWVSEPANHDGCIATLPRVPALFISYYYYYYYQLLIFHHYLLLLLISNLLVIIDGYYLIFKSDEKKTKIYIYITYTIVFFC